jgi:hypothetical protein
LENEKHLFLLWWDYFKKNDRRNAIWKRLRTAALTYLRLSTHFHISCQHEPVFFKTHMRYHYVQKAYREQCGALQSWGLAQLVKRFENSLFRTKQQKFQISFCITEKWNNWNNTIFWRSRHSLYVPRSYWFIPSPEPRPPLLYILPTFFNIELLFYPQYGGSRFPETLVTIVTWRQKAGIMESVETPIARQRIGKQVSAATATQATIDELLETMFSILSV